MLRCVHAMLELIDSELAFVADLRLLLVNTSRPDCREPTANDMHISHTLRLLA